MDRRNNNKNSTIIMKSYVQAQLAFRKRDTILFKCDNEPTLNTFLVSVAILWSSCSLTVPTPTANILTLIAFSKSDARLRFAEPYRLLPSVTTISTYVKYNYEELM